MNKASKEWSEMILRKMRPQGKQYGRKGFPSNRSCWNLCFLILSGYGVSLGTKNMPVGLWEDPAKSLELEGLLLLVSVKLFFVKLSRWWWYRASTCRACANPPSRLVPLHFQALFHLLRHFDSKKVLFLWVNPPLIGGFVVLFSYIMEWALSKLEIVPFRVDPTHMAL